MKNLTIKNIPEDVLLRITNNAKNKRMSQQEYIKNHLELLAYAPALKESDEKYAKLVKQVCDFIEYQTEEIKNIRTDIEKMILAENR